MGEKKGKAPAPVFGEDWRVSVGADVPIVVLNNLDSIDHFLQTRDELNNAIDQEFRKAGVEIAFPQRDLHLRSVKAALPIVADDGNSPEV